MLCTASFFIILGILLVTVYLFACRSVLVFIIVDSAGMAEVVPATKLFVSVRNSNNLKIL